MNPVQTLPFCFQSNHKKRNLEPEPDDVVFADSTQYRKRGNAY